MFTSIRRRASYSRKHLAELWGYASYHALARGVVTPQGTDKIILFVTGDKQTSLAQYRDRLRGNELDWEGPTDHFAERRIVEAAKTGDEIHLFYRDRHHSDFTYLGRLTLTSYRLHVNSPSEFSFRVG